MAGYGKSGGGSKRPGAPGARKAVTSASGTGRGTMGTGGGTKPSTGTMGTSGGRKMAKGIMGTC